LSLRSCWCGAWRERWLAAARELSLIAALLGVAAMTLRRRTRTTPGAENPAPKRHRREVGMILVTGATGNVGGELVRAVAGAGEEVSALIRREAHQSRLPEGVERVVGDLDHARP
jgi:hypothetical protein